MKLFLSTFLASMSMAAAVQDRGLQQIESTGTALKARWEMAEPTINYDGTTDVFTFTFGTASADNYDAGLTTSYWDERCKDTADGVNREIGYPLIRDPDPTITVSPVLKMVTSGASTKPTLEFKISTTDFVETTNDITYAANPVYKIDSPTTGNAETVFCIRNGLGYTAAPGTTTTFTNSASYQEVNYIETLVIIQYDLSSGFDVAAFQVEPKDREGVTEAENYSDALEAYLCVGPQTPGYDESSDAVVTTYNGDDFTIPTPLTAYAKGGASKFNQGALINICVRVKDQYATQGLRIDVITDFDFLRGDIQSVVGQAIVQEAIVANAPSPNFLTSFTQSNCYNNVYCDFASVLFAQFYATAGTVEGSGSGTLRFYNQARRLSESGKNGLRRLEEDAGPGSSEVDISVPVTGDVEGPGDLKTAGSTSLGATALASVAALVGAIVMA